MAETSEKQEFDQFVEKVEDLSIDDANAVRARGYECRPPAQETIDEQCDEAMLGPPA